MSEKQWTSVQIGSWEKLFDLYLGKSYAKVNFSLSPDKQTRWIFRAESAEANLQTHLEKAFRHYAVPTDMRQKCEMDIIKEFQRKASLYIGHEPHKDNVLEWLALMNHHGAATRLLDWTYSFFIAVYFALAEGPRRSIVWALNVADIWNPSLPVEKIVDAGHKDDLVRLHRKFHKRRDILRIRERGDKLKDLTITSCCLMRNPAPFVYPVNPFRLNSRLTIQQGLFMLPGDIRESFLTNLEETFRRPGGLKRCLRRIELPFREHNYKYTTERRNEILRQLSNMSINNAALFPGLDGFARSIQERLAYREVFGPEYV